MYSLASLATSFVLALAITLAMGWNLTLLGQLWVVLAFNVFSIPLLMFVFHLPWWVIYVAIVFWVGELI